MSGVGKQTPGHEADNTQHSCARVLLVDDQVIVAEAIRRMLLGEEDIKYHYCLDPGSAISEAAEFKPTVILQDLVMPDIDGLMLLGFLRANPTTRNIPIIVMSTKEDPVVKSEVFELGASDYLVKIPDRIELIARIRAHSRSFLAQQQRDEAHRLLQGLKAELEKKNQELHRLSSLDGLTGIPNRRRFDEYLEQEWLRAARSDKQLSLILIDIDYFKAFNDNYGHQGGDEVLREVAQTLERATHRPGDIVSRYGGEEFAVILPDTGTQGASRVAEMLRASVEALEIPHEHSAAARHVTISLGVASVTPGEGATATALIDTADEALYQAKKNGRNRYFVAPPRAPGNKPEKQSANS